MNTKTIAFLSGYLSRRDNLEKTAGRNISPGQAELLQAIYPNADIGLGRAIVPTQSVVDGRPNSIRSIDLSKTSIAD